MEVLYTKCAGLDVHRDTVVACVRVAVDSKVSQEVKTFGATTKELMALSEWLTGYGVTHVAMEATGVYWRPVWHVLDGSFELVLANAMHIKNVPGRKTDVSDAMWIADLLAHGLIRASFVPPTPVQDLRALTRTRKQLIRERASHVNRIDKILQDANLKLGSVLTDIMGQSGRGILQRDRERRGRPGEARRARAPRREGAAREDRRSAAWHGHPVPSLSAQAAPGPGGRIAEGHRRHRPGGG